MDENAKLELFLWARNMIRSVDPRLDVTYSRFWGFVVSYGPYMVIRFDKVEGLALYAFRRGMTQVLDLLWLFRSL